MLYPLLLRCCLTIAATPAQARERADAWSIHQPVTRSEGQGGGGSGVQNFSSSPLARG
jgi:hypothetical protein